MVVVQHWSTCFALLNSALYLRDTLLDLSLDADVASLDAVMARARAQSAVSTLSLQTSRRAVERLGQQALKGVSDVASGISTYVLAEGVAFSFEVA